MRVLVTGGSGYVGSAAVPALRERGHKVVTIGRRPGFDAALCDLRDPVATREAFRSVGAIDAVVHLAARAHDFRGVSMEEMFGANVSTTRNVVAAMRPDGMGPTMRLVHASSVTVYEILDAHRSVVASEAPYAASKLEAEEVVAADPRGCVCVLRFAPIYDPAHLRDVAKRVFLPGTRIKVRLYPPPLHSLCSLERAVEAIIDAVEKPLVPGVAVADIADPQPFSQHDLVGWFPGRALPVPSMPLRALAASLAWCGAPGRSLSRSIAKFISTAVWRHEGDLCTSSRAMPSRPFTDA